MDLVMNHPNFLGGSDNSNIDIKNIVKDLLTRNEIEEENIEELLLSTTNTTKEQWINALKKPSSNVILNISHNIEDAVEENSYSVSINKPLSKQELSKKRITNSTRKIN